MKKAISPKAQLATDQKVQMFLDGVDCELGTGAYGQEIHVGDTVASLTTLRDYYIMRLAKYSDGVYWEGVDIETGQYAFGDVKRVIVEPDD